MDANEGKGIEMAAETYEEMSRRYFREESERRTRRIAFNLAHPGAPIARESSAYGPCLSRGTVVRETARFYVVVDTFGDFKERKIAKSRVHVRSCQCCRDHKETMYPNGYVD